MISNRDMAFILRFLQSVKFNNEAAFAAIQSYFTWKNTKFPIKINKEIAELIVILSNFRIQALCKSLAETGIIDLS